MSRFKVGILESEPGFRDHARELLQNNGYAASAYPTPGRFFDALLKGGPDLVLMGLELPGMDGTEIIRVLRSNAETRGLLIVAVSAPGRTAAEVVNGFSAGADEYLQKPVADDLLLVRLASLLSRREPPREEVLKLGALAVSPERRSCSVSGKEVKLTRLEFDLLMYFLRQSNRVLTRSVLLEAVWKGDPTMETRTVDKHVEMLRRKLGPFAKRLETVVRVGYILTV